MDIILVKEHLENAKNRKRISVVVNVLLKERNNFVALI